VLVVLLGGCGFDRSGLTIGDAATPDPAIDAAVDAAVDAAAAPPCPDDPDLVACYRCEAGETPQPYDGSRYRNHGASSEVRFIAGHGVGTAMRFSPTASALVPDSASLDVTAITIELWLWVDALPPDGGRAGVLDDNGQYGLFLAPDGQLRCVIGGATDTGLQVPIAQWTHVACTYDGVAIRLYQDGVAGTVLATSVAIPTAGIDGLGLGQNVPDGDHLNGAVDDVQVWRRARTPDELCSDAGCAP